jgi:hypothetical protein
MAAETRVLSKVAKAKMILASYGYYLFHRDQASVAAPVVPSSLTDIQSISAAASAYTEVEGIQYGAKEKRLLRLDGNYKGSLKLLTGGVGDFMATALGQTWTAAGDSGIICTPPTYAVGHIEAVLRHITRKTEIHRVLYQDLIFDPFSFDLPNNLAITDLPFHSDYEKIILAPATKFVLDKWTGDGSTTTFTLSTTAIDVVDSAAEGMEQFDFDDMVFIKCKATTDDTGVRQSSGVTVNSGTSIVFTTAPATGVIVSAGYIAAQ